MRSMCVGVAETGVNPFLFLSFSFFSDKRKEHHKKSFSKYLFSSEIDRVRFANRSIIHTINTHAHPYS